jgi:hypothetical protein
MAEFRKVDLLQTYLKIWSQFTTGIGFVHKIFDYLVRILVSPLLVK